MRRALSLIIIINLIFPLSAKAEFEWVSYTLDNDLFLGNDGGYTNGFYVSLYDIEEADAQPTPSWLLKPLLWSLSEKKPLGAVNSYTIGQVMSTPDDITIEYPDENNLPYAGLLFFNNTYLLINEKYADKISTIIGFVGPLSFAEPSQKIVHELTGSDEPMGWDTQLKNELVFQFSRARAWRVWVAKNKQWDFITSSELSVGTISSSFSTGAMLRFGTQLMDSYAIPLLSSTRTTNPVATDGGWYVYTGLIAGYIFNRIFTDGNTYRDSDSIEFDNEYVGLTVGFAYSWKNYSLSFSVNDSNIIASESEEQLENLTQFGALTFAVKL